MTTTTASTCLLSTTYFGPVQWYQKLYRYDRVMVEAHESFQKQTYRNRCLIATPQGVQALTVPVVSEQLTVNSEEFAPAPDNYSLFTIHCSLVSDHGNWRHQHWQAITSAYGDSPFFEYYADDLRPFFTERRWATLLELNTDICRTLCQLLDIHPHVELTTAYEHHPQGCDDFREAIRPKHPLPDPDFQPRPYWQVFAQRQDFLPNLSILDLLFCMGPEAIFYL